MSHQIHDPSDEVDTALADLAIAAVQRLHIEMRTARNSKDRIAAANSILDRVGYSRTARAQAEVADTEIRRALKAAIQRGVSPEAADELERAIDEETRVALEELARDEERAREEKAAERAADDARYEEQRDERQQQQQAEQAEAEQAEAEKPKRKPRAQKETDPATETIVVEAQDVRTALAAMNADGEIPDFSELGPDDEENDAWLNA